MKIRQLDTIRLEEYPNLLFVQLHTDDGLVGLGETYFGARTVEAYLHETVAPFILGESADDPERHGESLVGYVGFSSSGAETRGNSAVEIALWDLLGQSRGLPLHRLLGDAARTELPVYNTCAGPRYVRQRQEVASSNWGISPVAEVGSYEDLDAFLHRADELAESLLAQDIRGMKIWPFDVVAESTGGQYISRHELAECVLPVEKIRRAVGDRIDVMVELHGLWNVPMAQRIASALEEFDLRWIEDPVRLHDFAALGRVSASTGVPIAAGETLGGTSTHERMIEAGGVSVVIADIAWAGGIAEGRKIAALAQAAGREMAFHDCTGPVVLTASTHLALVTPNVRVQEVVRAFYWGWYGELVTGLPPIENGTIKPPAGPGLGIALQPDLLQRPGVSVRSSRMH